MSVSVELSVEAPGEDDDSDTSVLGEQWDESPGLVLGGVSGQIGVLDVSLERAIPTA